MGSKFLDSKTTNLATLQDGSFPINVSSAIVQNLAPNLPVRTTLNKSIISGLIGIADCSFVPITNPMSADFDMGNNDIINVLSLLLTTNPTPIIPPTGMLTLYESGNKLRYTDSSAVTYQVATNGDLGSYLPLAGGTMAGVINMGTQEITNIGALRFKDTNMTLGSSSTIGTGTSDNVNIGNATTVGFGAAQNVLIGLQASLNTTTAGNVVIGTLAASTLGGYSTIIGQQAQARGNAVAVGKEAAAGPSSVVVGFRSSSGINTDSVVIGHDNTSSGTSADILGVNRTNNQANSLLLGNGAYINIRANTTCDLGTAAVPFQSLYINSSIAGPVNSRTVDNIISCTTNGVSGDIATFTGTAKVLQDSGVLLSSLLSSATAAATYLPLTGGTMFGNINLGAYGIGLGATANSGTCIGNGSNCGNGASVALGNLANAAGFGGIAIGNASVCSTNNSLALGISANNSAVGGVAIGRQCINSGIDAISIGTNANCSFLRAICIGTSSAASVAGAIALGYAANNSTANSLLVGVTANIRSTVTTCDLGTVAVPFQSLYINSNVAGPTNSRSADNIVSNAGAATLGRVATFSTDKVIQDGGTLLSDLATNASVLAAGAGYLAKSGGTMTGSINFGQNNATGFNYIQSGITAGNVIWGSGTTISTPPPGNNIRNVYLGYNNDGVGFALNLIGNECHQTVGAGLCNLIGSSLNVIGASSSAYGDGTTVTGTTSVAIGSNNTISVSNGYVFGAGATNSIANSMLLGSVNITNIRANSLTCDLGTAAAPFRNLILNTGIESTAGLVIGPASATSIAIGRATVTTTINGIFATPLPFGTWYSTTTFNPSFAAGVNRLTPPTAATAGTLVDFTHALGVLTYTGTRTRQFHIAYNITFTAGPNGTNMTFFNSIAASTIIGTTQSQQRQQVTTQLASTQMSLTVIDNITLTTGQSVQLAGACAALSAAVGYNFISCAILAMPN